MKKIDFKTIIIFGLIVGILCLRFCSVKPDGKVVTIDGKPYEVIKHTVDTLYVPTVQTVYKRGKDIYKEVPVYVQLPGDVDTVQVIKDYYSKVVYKDTLKLKDSLGYVSITDTIFNNSILGRVWDSHINKITINDRMIVKELPKNQFYLGSELGLNNQTVFTSFSPSLLLKTKKDRIFSIGVGLGPNQSIQCQGGVYIKLW
jgi:hypothetical protein